MRMSDLKEAEKLGASQAEEATESLERIKALPIADVSGLRFAVALTAEVKDRSGEFEAVRKRFVDPLNAVVKDLNAQFKPAGTSLSEAEGVLKGKISDFVLAQRAKRQAMIKQASEASQAGDSAEAERLIAEAEKLEVPKIPGLAVNESWGGEVENPDEIPREFLIPDVKALAALTKAKKGDPKIPGWRASPTATVAITVSKVKR